MNERPLRQSGVTRPIGLLAAALAFVFGLVGWASEAPRDQPPPLPLLTQKIVIGAAALADMEAEAALDAERSRRSNARDQLPQDQVDVSGDGPGERSEKHALEDAPTPPAASVAPSVEVRVGDHGEFERVVFEWPEPIEHDVVQSADRVAVTFGRPGRIDFSPVRDRFGQRVVEAFAEGGESTRRVVLRVAPDVRIRSFSLEDDRIVVVDLFGGSAPRRLGSAAPQPELRPMDKPFREPAVRAESSWAGTRAPFDVAHAPVPATGDAAPKVEVRTGDHGAYERVVFEWPEGVEYEVTQRAQQVAITFSRAGRIDLSRLREGFGRRVVRAWAEDGEATDWVILQVVPNARIRSFALENSRIVAIDVYAETTAQAALSPKPEPEGNSVRALRDALEQRDAVIENLLARMEQLERRLGLPSGDLDAVVAGAAGAAGTAGSTQPPTAAQGDAPESSASSEQQAPAASESQGGEPANDPQRAPGQFDVAEEDIDRALERTLVQTGALLLPSGQAEIEPSFSYTRREGDVPVLFTENGTTFVASQDVRRNEFESGQILRVGMPFDSQVEIGVPYRYVDQSAVTEVGGQARQELDGSGQGAGDISVGVAKTLLRENGGWWPDLVARLTWDTGTGETTDGDVLLGGGFNELRGSLNAVKRQDPLAFVGGVSYETTFEDDDVKPGDEFAVNIGTVLAASPETSLRLALGQRFIDEARVDGESISGSDRVVGTATIGASVVLGRGVLLDVAADIGLTDDAPDYAARASLPIRFNLPAY